MNDDEYDSWVDKVVDAYEDYMSLTPAERSEYHDDFLDYWDMDPEEESLFWELYRES